MKYKVQIRITSGIDGNADSVWSDIISVEADNVTLASVLAVKLAEQRPEYDGRIDPAIEVISVEKEAKYIERDSREAF